MEENKQILTKKCVEKYKKIKILGKVSTLLLVVLLER